MTKSTNHGMRTRQVMRPGTKKHVQSPHRLNDAKNRPVKNSGLHNFCLYLQPCSKLHDEEFWAEARIKYDRLPRKERRRWAAPEEEPKVASPVHTVSAHTLAMRATPMHWNMCDSQFSQSVPPKRPPFAHPTPTPSSQDLIEPLRQAQALALATGTTPFPQASPMVPIRSPVAASSPSSALPGWSASRKRPKAWERKAGSTGAKESSSSGQSSRQTVATAQVPEARSREKKGTLKCFAKRSSTKAMQKREDTLRQLLRASKCGGSSPSNERSECGRNPVTKADHEPAVLGTEAESGKIRQPTKRLRRSSKAMKLREEKLRQLLEIKENRTNAPAILETKENVCSNEDRKENMGNIVHSTHNEPGGISKAAVGAKNCAAKENWSNTVLDDRRPTSIKEEAAPVGGCVSSANILDEAAKRKAEWSDEEIVAHAAKISSFLIYMRVAHDLRHPTVQDVKDWRNLSLVDQGVLAAIYSHRNFLQEVAFVHSIDGEFPWEYVNNPLLWNPFAHYMKDTVGSVCNVDAILQAEKDLFNSSLEVKRKYICS